LILLLGERNSAKLLFLDCIFLFPLSINPRTHTKNRRHRFALFDPDRTRIEIEALTGRGPSPLRIRLLLLRRRFFLGFFCFFVFFFYLGHGRRRGAAAHPAEHGEAAERGRVVARHLCGRWLLALLLYRIGEGHEQQQTAVGLGVRGGSVARLASFFGRRPGGRQAGPWTSEREREAVGPTHNTAGPPTNLCTRSIEKMFQSVTLWLLLWCRPQRTDRPATTRTLVAFPIRVPASLNIPRLLKGQFRSSIPRLNRSITL
jgi:hypothetical protein